MDLDPLTAFKFSYATQPPQSREARILLEAARGKQIREGKEVLRRFPVLKSWFDIIAQANSLQPEHPLVAEAYWIGSSLLDRDYKGRIQKIHENFIDQFPEKFDGRKTPEIPFGMPAHHNTHVMAYGIITNPEATPEQERECLVTPARMIEERKAQNWINGLEMSVINPLGHDLRTGTMVAVHRGVACAILDDQGLDNLTHYGFANLER